MGSDRLIGRRIIIGSKPEFDFRQWENFSLLHQVLALQALHPKQKQKSHFTTSGQSVNPSWSRAPHGAYDQILVSVRPLLRSAVSDYSMLHSRSKATGAWTSPITYHKVPRGKNSGTLSPGLVYAFTVWHRDRSTFAIATKNVRCYIGTDDKTIIHILVYFPYFEKIKVCLCDLRAVCMPLCLWPPLN